MSKTVLALCGALAIAGLTLAAQTPQTTRPDQPTPSATSDSTLTVTGCLKPWTASMTGGAPAPNPESGAPTTTGAEAMYVLTDIDDSGGKPGSRAGTTGATAAPGTGASGSTSNPQAMYLLKPKDATVNLSQHVNHKVQVSGTVSSDSTRSGSSTSPMAKPGDPPSSTSPRDMSPTSAAGKPATLTVGSITMVSSTCPTTR